MVVSSEVSSVVEHQTDNLAVTGSTPVPTPQAKHLLRCGPREAGQRVIGHRRVSDRRRRGFRAEPGGIVALPGTRLPCGSMAECHVVRGYRFHRPEGTRQWMLGDSRWALARRRRAGRKLLCRRRLCGSSNSTPHAYV